LEAIVNSKPLSALHINELYKKEVESHLEFVRTDLVPDSDDGDNIYRQNKRGEQLILRGDILAELSLNLNMKNEEIIKAMEKNHKNLLDIKDYQDTQITAKEKEKKELEKKMQKLGQEKEASERVNCEKFETLLQKKENSEKEKEKSEKEKEKSEQELMSELKSLQQQYQQLQTNRLVITCCLIFVIVGLICYTCYTTNKSTTGDEVESIDDEVESIDTHHEDDQDESSDAEQKDDQDESIDTEQKDDQDESTDTEQNDDENESADMEQNGEGSAKKIKVDENDGELNVMTASIEFSSSDDYVIQINRNTSETPESFLKIDKE